MFFIRCGAAIAWGLVLWGVLRVVTGIYLAATDAPLVQPDLLQRYLDATTQADALNEGIMCFGAGIVLGLLVQIARGVKFD